MVMYNTLMGVAAAAGLLLIVAFGYLVWRGDRPQNLSAWAWTFAPLGLILVVMGAHMSLTWPLKPAPASLSPHCCAADNIIFGEPSLFFGALLLSIERSAAWRAWDAPATDPVAPGATANRADAANAANAANAAKARELLAQRLLPLAALGAVAGLTLFPIGLAGLFYGMFIAPPNEPFSSIFRANYIET